MGRASRPRGPEDRKPDLAPVYSEIGGTRYELPVLVAGVAGTLVIRCFDSGKVEASARGRAAALLERLR